LLLFISVTSCRRSHDCRPTLQLPENWKNPVDWKSPVDWNRPVEENIYPDAERWWTIFNDGELSHLIEQSIAYNQSLEVAVQNLSEARAFIKESYAQFLPSLDFAPSYFNQEILVLGAPNEAAFSSSPFRFHNRDYTLPFNLNYEVDLWGKISDGYAASLYRYQASLEALRGVWLSITTDVAQNYFLLRSLDNQLASIEKALDVRKNAIEVNQSRYDSGLINFADVSRAKLEYIQAQADRENILRLRAIQENALALLCGAFASEFKVERTLYKVTIPQISSGLPSELLCRRPDILEAENAMAALHAEMGIAYTSFFPSLTLNGALGLYSPVLKDLLTWKARLWSFGFDLLQNVFDGGARCALYEAAKSRYFQGLAAYQNQVLVAFKDVENALVNIQQRELEAHYLLEGIDAAQDTYGLSQERYLKGFVTYLDVVDIERSVLMLEQEYAAVQGEQLISLVSLIKALGGGW
jgi:outer membrane protein, multidrug efflux system